MIGEIMPTTHEVYLNDKPLGTICPDCLQAGLPRIRTMLEPAAEEPIEHETIVSWLDISTET